MEKFCKKIGQKFGQKFGKKFCEKFGKIIKCDHTNSGRQFVVIEFTNLVEFMNVIE